MIDAEMYGMMFSAKIDIRPSAPPENMSNIPIMPAPPPWSKISDRTEESTPGIGI